MTRRSGPAAPRSGGQRALIVATLLIGLLLVWLGVVGADVERERQLRQIATQSRVVEAQVAALANGARDRVMALRNAAQIAYDRAAAGTSAAGSPPLGDVMEHPRNPGTERDLAVDLAAFDQLWLTQAGVHKAAPDMALSWILSAKTGATANYPPLTPEARASMRASAARHDFVPGTNPFLKLVQGRSADAPPVWTPVYFDPHAASTRSDRKDRGDGRVLSLIAPVLAHGTLRAEVGTDIWATEFGRILAAQHVPGTAFTLIDGDRYVVATSDPTGERLDAAPMFDPRDATLATDVLGFDIAEVPPGPGTHHVDGRYVSAQAIAGTPLRLVAVIDGGFVRQQTLARVAPLVAAIALLYIVLCVVVWYVLRRVLDPAFRLAHYVESFGSGPPPRVSRLWQPTLDAVDAGFGRQRRALAALEEAHATTSAVIDAAFDAVVLVDAELRIVSANLTFMRLFAPGGPSCIGEPLVPLIAGGKDRARLTRHLVGGGEATIGFTADGGGGRRFPAELQDRLLRPERDLRVVFIRDVSERRRFEAEVASQREALHQTEKLSALGGLLAGVSHELNNPLAVVVGRSALLAEQLAGTPHEGALRKLRDAADRCGRIVRTFLAIARRSAPERRLVDLNALVGDALDITGYGLRTAGVALEVRLDPDLPRTSADGDQLVQVIINLVVNAQHALMALPEGRPRRLSIRTEHVAARNMLRLTVADSGPGIAPDLAGRIFEPFFTTKPVGEGTGMGLSVSRGIVEAHGGAITLDSEPSTGAVFHVTLPVDRSTRTPRAASAPAAEAPGDTRVLIVDDEPDVAQLLADCLAGGAVAVKIVDNGAAAVAAVRDTRFDAIFCDVRMPGIDGFETSRRIAAVSPDQARRIVFVTGDILSGETRERIAATGAAVIEKPFDPAAVRAALAALARPAEPIAHNN